MHVNGLPLHPLIVHLVVVLAPAVGVLAIIFALVPSWRWWSRLPLLVSGVVGALATWLAAASGDKLKQQLGIRGDLIEKHEMWAGRLQASMWVVAALAGVAWWVMPYRTRLAGGADRAARVGVLVKPLMVLLPVAGVVVMFLVFETGEAGARSVWIG